MTFVVVPMFMRSFCVDKMVLIKDHNVCVCVRVCMRACVCFRKNKMLSQNENVNLRKPRPLFVVCFEIVIPRFVRLCEEIIHELSSWIISRTGGHAVV